MKMIDYKNTLAIVSLIEVLKEKGIIDENDVSLKARVWTRLQKEILDLRIKEAAHNCAASFIPSLHLSH